jgi:phage/conjugal plasmid C-4 type zinc finger TraR family protein
MDEGDFAAEYEYKMREVLLQKHINRPNDPVRVINGKHFCIDCGEEIEEKRVKVLGVVGRCISCQELYEEGLSFA